MVVGGGAIRRFLGIPCLRRRRLPDNRARENRLMNRSFSFDVAEPGAERATPRDFLRSRSRLGQNVIARGRNGAWEDRHDIS